MVGSIRSSVGAREQIRDRIHEVERELDANRYTSGPWAAVTGDASWLAPADRAALAEDISRVSRKIHLRRGRRTISIAAGLGIEVALTVVGAILLGLGVRQRSDLLVIIAALLWAASFQPLIKCGVGYLLGVGYEYAYLFAFEPRFKMRLGDYVARRRWARILFHLSGMVGSPLGVWIPAACAGTALWLARDVCWALLWLLIAINLIALIAGIAGIRRLGRMPLRLSSGGSAAQELREALEI